ncbi:MOS1T transposase, partial [Pseudoatta argentina]
LMQLNRTLKQKRPDYAKRHDKVIFQHDNAWSLVAKPVKETLNWDILLHPPYSPDIAPYDYHLFQLIIHGLSEQRFHSYEDTKKWIDSWIASKDMLFF